jgi:hypothetical protein
MGAGVIQGATMDELSAKKRNQLRKMITTSGITPEVAQQDFLSMIDMMADNWGENGHPKINHSHYPPPKLNPDYPKGAIGIRHEIKFSNGAALFVLVSWKGEVIERGMILGSTREFNKEIVQAVSKTIPQQQKGGRKAGHADSTITDYIRIKRAWEIAKSKGMTAAEFCERMNITEAKRKAAIRNAA